MKYKYTQKEIVDSLPETWSEVKFKTYLELMKLKVNDSEDPLDIMNTNLQICSMFLNLPVEIVEQFPMSTIRAINKRLEFLSTKAKPKTNSKYIWKTNLIEPTYDDFITFIKVSEQINQADLSNFPLLVKIMLKSPLTEEEILELPMDEIEYGFFLLRKFSMNYLKTTIKDLTIKTIVMKTNEMMDQMDQIQGMQFKKRLKVIREKYKELTVGFSSQRKQPTSLTVTTSPLWKNQP